MPSVHKRTYSSGCMSWYKVRPKGLLFAPEYPVSIVEEFRPIKEVLGISCQHLIKGRLRETRIQISLRPKEISILVRQGHDDWKILRLAGNIDARWKPSGISKYPHVSLQKHFEKYSTCDPSRKATQTPSQSKWQPTVQHVWYGCHNNWKISMFENRWQQKYVTF